MDAFATIASYSPDAERTLRKAGREAGLRLYAGPCALPYDVFFGALPADHHAFFDRLVLSYETDDCICSHAGVDPSVERLCEQPARALVWGHSAFPASYRGSVPVVYGHWNNAELDGDGWPVPAITGNTVGIDTIGHGVLTGVLMPDRRVFQSSRHPHKE